MDGPRPELAPYLDGSLDTRSFSIDGSTIFLTRSRTSREVGFYGQGRDGDFVPPGFAAAAVFDRVVRGLPGLVALGDTGCAAESEEALARAEAALLAAAGAYGTICRGLAPGAPMDAAALLRAPRLAGRRRSIYLRRGLQVTIEHRPGAGGAPETVGVSVWASGGPVGDLVPSILARLGASTERVRGPANSPEYALPPALAAAFLDAILAALDPRDVRITDG